MYYCLKFAVSGSDSGIGLGHFQMGIDLVIFAILGIGGALLGLVGLLFSRVAQTGPAWLRFAVAPRLCHVVLAIGGPALALVWSWRINEAAESNVLPYAQLCPTADLNVATNYWTDSSRKIHVVGSTNDDGSLAPTAPFQNRCLLAPAPIDQLSQLAPGSPTYNCHGWIFSDGAYWINDDQVEAILTDNGYIRTETVHANDLVIYRDEQGVISHSAVVRLATKYGVVVESKWGTQGRYLHFETEYPGTRTYYHSQRVGHLLHTQPPGPATEQVAE